MTYTIQEQAIRGFGAEICHVVKYWRPAIPTAACPFCGRKFYHIMSHWQTCEQREPEMVEPQPVQGVLL